MRGPSLVGQTLNKLWDVVLAEAPQVGEAGTHQDECARPVPTQPADLPEERCSEEDFVADMLDISPQEKQDLSW